MPVSQKTKEVKLLQRRDKYDLNIMLLHTYYVSITKQSVNSVLSPGFHREFIDKCFLCGCSRAQAGVAISYFVVQRISFVLFAQEMGNGSQTGENKIGEHKIEQISEFLLSALVKALHPHEDILIYDDTRIKCINLPQNKTNLLKFIHNDIFKKGFLNIFLRNNKKLPEKSDDLPKIYNALRAKFKGFVIKVYYTLIDDTMPNLPKGISANFFFCKKSYRTQYPICRTKNYVETDINSPDELFKELYEFVGQKQPPIR